MKKKTRKHYTADFKAKIVKEMLKEDKTVGQIAAEYEVHSNMLYRWREQMLAGLPGLFNDQTAQQLAEKEAEWRQERETFYAEIGRLTSAGSRGWGKKRGGKSRVLTKATDRDFQPEATVTSVGNFLTATDRFFPYEVTCHP
jgi:transposase